MAINAWYAPFYDLIQRALSAPHKVTIGQFYHETGVFLGIAMIAVTVAVLNNFFVSHYVFRWRTAMNEYYMANWHRLRHIEGAAQRVQEDTMRFSSTLEDMGVSLLNAIMKLIAFLPILVALSPHVPELPIVGHVPYGLVIAAIVWSLVGTGLLAMVGIKLPGLAELFPPLLPLHVFQHCAHFLSANRQRFRPVPAVSIDGCRYDYARPDDPDH